MWDEIFLIKHIFKRIKLLSACNSPDSDKLTFNADWIIKSDSATGQTGSFKHKKNSY